MDGQTQEQGEKKGMRRNLRRYIIMLHWLLGATMVALLVVSVALIWSKGAFTRTIITETIEYHISDYNPRGHNDALMYPIVKGVDLKTAGFIEGGEVESLLVDDVFYQVDERTILNLHESFRWPWENPLDIYDTFKEARVIYDVATR